MQSAVHVRTMHPADGENEFAVHCLDGIPAAIQMHAGQIETAAFGLDGDHAGDVAIGDGDIGIICDAALHHSPGCRYRTGSLWN